MPRVFVFISIFWPALFFGGFFFLSPGLPAQQLPLKHFDPDDKEINAPGQFVVDLYQDQVGYIWVATYNNGLFRYDGRQFESIPVDTALTGGRISWVKEDPQGRLWVDGVWDNQRLLYATSKSLVDMLPGDSLVFIQKDKLPDGQIRFDPGAAFVSSGHLFSILKSQLAVFRPNQDSLTWYYLDSLKVGKTDEPLIPISILPVDSQQILAAINTGAISRIGKDGQVFWTREDFLRSDPAKLEVPILREMIHGRKDEIWSGSTHGEWVRLTDYKGLDPKIQTWYSGNPMDIANPQIVGDSLLLASYGKTGLIEASISNPEQFQVYGQEAGFTSTYFWDILKDRDGNLWLGHNLGISRLDRNYHAFRYFNKNAGRGFALINDEVTGIEVDFRPRQGAEPLTLVATVSGLDAIDAEGQVTHINLPGVIEQQTLLGITKDDQGRVWIAAENGVVVLIPMDQNFGFKGFSDPQTIRVSGQSFRVSNISVGRTLGISVLNLPGDQGSRSPVYGLLGSSGFLCALADRVLVFSPWTGVPKSGFLDMAVDDLGYLYGTETGGGALYRSMEPLTKTRLTQFETKGFEQPGLRAFFRVMDSVFAPVNLVYEGDTLVPKTSLISYEGNILLQTDKGLALIGGDKGEVLKLYKLEKNGIRPQAFGMIYDPGRESVWLGSGSNGLWKFNLEKEEIDLHLTESDGLSSDVLFGPSALKIDQKGRIFFGSDRGITRFDPDHFHIRSPELKVVIKSAELQARPGGFNIFSATFSTLTYGQEDLIQYQTRLLGFEKNWSESTSRRDIRFTNLPAIFFPKAYELQVRARVGEGPWSKQVASYVFSVRPIAFFQWWAFLIYFILLFLVVRYFIQRRTRKAEEELARERQVSDRLREIDKLKDQFLANTSHELRTPLNGIIGLAEGLRAGEEKYGAQERKDVLSLMISAGKRLNNLVNDLLDFSRLRNDNINIDPKPVDLRSMVDVVLKVNQGIANHKDLELLNEVPADLPTVFADENRLEQVLYNLVGNSLKFTTQGEVRVLAEVKSNMVEVAIADTGIGISPEKQKTIFEAFVQADGSIQRQYGGTGLGLSISRQLVELMGGTMRVESEVGQGTTMYFTLPVSGDVIEKKEQKSEVSRPRYAVSAFEMPIDKVEEPEIPLTPASMAASPKVRILIVDDEVINLEVLRQHLSGETFEITLAHNGEEALTALDTGSPFDLVLLDVMMPRMSGFEVCQKIRERYLPSELPVILVTAKTQVQDLVAGLSHGANDYVAKPFSKDELMARVRTHLNLHHMSSASMRFVPREFLRALGYETLTHVQLGDQVERNVTVFFADIRGYTSIAEAMTPEQNFRFVSEYAARMGPIIREHHGFVHQYLGDGILALFPEDPVAATRAAIAMQENIYQFNRQGFEGLSLPLKVGMGLHTGPLIMGVIGDQKRNDAALISDTVNTASRLEGLTKIYGAALLVSGEIYQACQEAHDLKFRYLGKVQVKGKERPVEIYDCLNAREHPQAWLKTKDAFEKALSLYYQKAFEEAKSIFEKVKSENPDDLACDWFLRQIMQLTAGDFPEGWDGVQRMAEK